MKHILPSQIKNHQRLQVIDLPFGKGKYAPVLSPRSEGGRGGVTSRAWKGKEIMNSREEGLNIQSTDDESEHLLNLTPETQGSIDAITSKI
ncbi:uncharacterized protein LOC122030936 isoform X2 [Zingiber officinale]|uniref:uncharacterized protein LOC122030936 isoform X2 n=1 Tax=Zingiber officinale TaxID=94328 RepID=UPI001C4C1A13|nr:uncharacterized protein LOC122030936 isoform X2 [Zingiber officinale]